MNPIKHPTSNHSFAAPRDWDESAMGPCETLHVRVEQQDGLNAMTSHWKPSPEELAFLNANGSVALTIIAGGHPVVSVGVE